MNTVNLNNIRPFFTILNLVIGWHLLYEGIVKILTPGWTSAGYLVNARGPLAGVFQHIAESPGLLQASDWLNIAGLTIIGFCIFSGILTRAAAIAGALLISLYYIANPPLAATGVGFASEGHYLLVNKNLIEIAVLIVVAAIPSECYYGIGKLLPKLPTGLFRRVRVPTEMNHEPKGPDTGRRELVKNLISLPLLGGFAFAVAKNHGWKSHEEDGHRQAMTDATTSPTIRLSTPIDLRQLRKPIPKGDLCGLDIGRIICGGNLISGFAHSRDLIYVSQFLKNYFTEKKVMDTFWLCEECGITATAVSARPEPVAILQKYWNNGGNIKWIAPTYPKEEDYRSNIDFAIDNGASAAMIMGNVGDEWSKAGKWDLMAEVVAYIRSRGVPAGVAGHEIETIKGAESHNVGADFYMKTLHSNSYWSWQPDQKKDKRIIENYATDNYWERTPEETIAFMESLNKPWIAFKVMAAGAIHPKQAFRYAFENGADFVCAGMFDYQVVEDANILTGILDSKNFNRKRDWIA